MLSQEFATFYLTMCDFVSQPGLRHWNVCDKWIRYKVSIPLMHYLSLPPHYLARSHFTGHFGGLCCSFNMHK